jgi:hypothetical protein
MRHLFAVVFVLAMGLVSAHCGATLPILADTKDAQGCWVSSEHDCHGGGCCWNNWQCCGFQSDHEPITCNPDGTCEDTNEPPPNDFGVRKRRAMPQRRP